MDSIFAQVPWLKTFIAWAVALAVVVLVLALPAYYMFLPLTKRLRAELSRYLALVRARHAQNRAERREADREFFAQYAQDRLLRHIDASSGRLWERTKRALLQPVHDIQSQLASVTADVGRFHKALPEVHERLQAIVDAIPKDLQLTTDSAGLSQATGSLRVARMALISCTLLAIALITVNTGMLSQIVRDLGFIPPSFKFMNIPLFYVLALLITFVEAGLGVIHGVLSEPDFSDERFKIHVGSTLVAFGAVGVACVEGFFYSRIMPNRTDTVTIPLVNYTLAQTDIFFIWGFLLVMTLFGLGLIVFRMSSRVLRGTALSALRKQLRTFTKESTRWSSALREAESIVNTAKAGVGPYGENVDPPAPFAAAAVERLLFELRELVQAPPQWVSVIQQSLGPSEVLHLARHALLWLVLATIGIVLSTWTAVSSFSILASAVGNPLILAFGQALMVATVGFLMGWGEIVVEGNSWQKVTSPSWGRIIGAGLAGILALAYLLVFIGAYASGILVLWAGNLFLCLVAVAACYQLIPLLGLAGVWARRAMQVALGSFERIYRGLIGTLFLTAIFLDHLVMIVAGPITVFKGSRATVSNQPSTYADEPK